MIHAEFPSKSEEMKTVRLFKVSAIWRHPRAKRLVQKDFIISASSGEDAKEIAQQHLPNDMMVKKIPVNTIVTNELKLHIFDYGRPDNQVTYYESPLMECTIGRTSTQPVRTILEPMVQKIQTKTTTETASTSENTEPETQTEPSVSPTPTDEPKTNPVSIPETEPKSNKKEPEPDIPPVEPPVNEQNSAEPSDLPEEQNNTDHQESIEETDETEINTENETNEHEETEHTQDLIWLNNLFLSRFAYEMGRMQNLPDVPDIFLMKMQTIVQHPQFWEDLTDIVSNWIMDAYEKNFETEQDTMDFLQKKINAFVDTEGKKYLNQKEDLSDEKETD